jgi:hypothetical protein
VAQATKTGENIQISRFVRYRMGEGAEADPVGGWWLVVRECEP